MENGGSNQNGILAKVNKILRIVLGNRAIQIFALILTLIATVATKEVRVFVGLEKAQIKRPSMSEPALSDDDLKASYAPFEYTVNEHQSRFVKDAQTSLSVVFQNIDGEDFVSLNISPTGEKSSVRAVLSGYTEEFKSSSGVFNVQILNIDYDSKKVVVQVSRKS